MIKLIIEEHYSKPDIHGNRYWATRVTSSQTGDTFTYNDNTNNGKGYARNAGFEWDEIHATEIAHKIRDFNSFTKTWPYLSTKEITAKMEKMK